jgi:hypothetical protein
MTDRRPPQGRGQAAYDGATRVLAVVMIALGVLLALRGEPLAAVVGVALVAAGIGRLWVLSRLRRQR